LDTESVDENWTIKVFESLYSDEQIKYFDSKFMEYSLKKNLPIFIDRLYFSLF